MVYSVHYNILDNTEQRSEQWVEDRRNIIQLQADVKRFHRGQVLQQEHSYAVT